MANKEIQRRVKNIKQSVRYYTKKGVNSPDSLLSNLVKELSSKSTKKAVAAAERTLNSLRRNVNIDKEVARAIKLGIAKPSRNKKTREKQIERVKQAEKNFLKGRDKFIREQRKYNMTVPYDRRSMEMKLMPHNAGELIEANKLLAMAKRQDFVKLHGLLSKKLTVQMTLRGASTKYFGEGMTYKQYVFMNTSIREAANSAFPQLANVLRKGGIQFIEDLVEAGFMLHDYANSLVDGETEEEVIISKLKLANKYLTGNSKKLLSDFLKKY